MSISTHPTVHMDTNHLEALEPLDRQPKQLGRRNTSNLHKDLGAS